MGRDRHEPFATVSRCRRYVRFIPDCVAKLFAALRESNKPDVKLIPGSRIKSAILCNLKSRTPYHTSDLRYRAIDKGTTIHHSSGVHLGDFAASVFESR